MTYACIVIGNSDDKLTQEKWSHFTSQVAGAASYYADKVHGQFFSIPYSKYQNACYLIEVDVPSRALLLDELKRIGSHFDQDSIFLLEGKGMFIEGKTKEQPEGNRLGHQV